MHSTVLVTGGAGFIGSAVVRTLIAETPAAFATSWRTAIAQLVEVLIESGILAQS